MKNKNLVFFGLIVLCILLLVLSFVFPLDELFSAKISIAGLCIGSGCKIPEGGCSGLPCPQMPYCDGYGSNLLCFSEKEKYCKFSYLFDDPAKCFCMTNDTETIKGYIKFCSKDKKCYNNPWDYEFGCAENLETVCGVRERELGSLPSCYNCMDPFVKRCSECDKSWVDRYSSANMSERIEMFKRGAFTKDTSPLGDKILLKDYCALLCGNCNSSLCDKGSVCEYVRYPVGNVSGGGAL